MVVWVNSASSVRNQQRKYVLLQKERKKEEEKKGASVLSIRAAYTSKQESYLGQVT
jgi:hypothetical protein